MSRALYVGGFGNGQSSVERVASALGDYFDDIDAFTFSQAMSQPDTIRRAAY
jgi:hypothetical protein